ncbi:hypothetical protein HanPI659440_Chr17g0674741 [Helianthus annuus]|nr:hypothetical protein HanPI659440_Chr17g0674741 [Helianthus annuus]
MFIYFFQHCDINFIDNEYYAAIIPYQTKPNRNRLNNICIGSGIYFFYCFPFNKLTPYLYHIVPNRTTSFSVHEFIYIVFFF